MKSRLAIIIFSFVLLAGCSTTPRGPAFVPEAAAADSALLYVFRRDTPPYARKPDIKVNDTVVAELPTNSYFAVRLQPGSYVVKSDWGLLDALMLNRSTTVNLVAGYAYYIEFTGKAAYYGGTSVGFGAGVSNNGAALDPPPQIYACSKVEPVASAVKPR